MNGWKNSVGFLFYYIDFFYNLLYNYYRIKKEKRYFIMAIIGMILIFGVIYVGLQILFDIFFGGK